MRRLAEMLGALFAGREHERERQEIHDFEARVEAHERKIDRWEKHQNRLLNDHAAQNGMLRRK